MKKRWKKLICLIIGGTMILSMFGCGGGKSEGESADTQADSGKKVIKFFHRFPDEPYNSFIEEKIAEYEENHPDIDIEIMSAQNDPYKEKIKVLVGSEDCPDIFFSFPGEFSERFIREGLVMDMTPYFEADSEWKDSLLESQMAQYTTSDGMIYGIPFRLDAKIWFYNKDIFQECGISELPETWDEFLDVCETIKSKGYTPIAYGNVDKWPASLLIGALNLTTVSNEVREKDYVPQTAEFTDSGYVEAMEYYQELIPYFTEGAQGTTWDIARNSFSQGKAAMFYPEVVEIPYILEENPDLNMGMFSFPLIQGNGDSTILPGSPEGFLVSSKTEYPDECMEFLKWFLGPEVGAEMAKEVNWFNASKEAVNGIEDPMLKDAYNVIAEAKSMSPWFDNVLYSTVKEEYYTQLSNLTNGDVTPQEAMEKIQKVVKESKSLLGEESSSE